MFMMPCSVQRSVPIKRLKLSQTVCELPIILFIPTNAPSHDSSDLNTFIFEVLPHSIQLIRVNISTGLNTTESLLKLLTALVTSICHGVAIQRNDAQQNEERGVVE